MASSAAAPKFQNKVAIITGASTGIGRVTAIHFTKHGCKVVITARNKANLDQTAAECEKYVDKSFILPIIGDMTCDKDVEKIVNMTVEHFGQIDILVNNAGILGRQSIFNTNMDEFDQLMNINVRSVFYITKLCVPHLIKVKGCIVNVSSVSGLRCFPGILPYCMSKGAMDQFTRCLALELAEKQVRVNSVNPGVISTGIHMRGIASVDQESYEKFLEHCKTTHPLGRAGEAQEVADLISFLASNESSYINGATIPIDGGRHATCAR